MPIEPHVDVVFPTSYRFRNTRGGAEFSTTVLRTKGGKSYRNVNWVQELQRWELSFFDNLVFIETVRAFHRARLGRAQSFLMKDQDDYLGTGEVIGTGTGALTTFALKKNYSSGGITYARTITKPRNGTVTIYLNGAVQSTGWTVSAVMNEEPFTPLATGIVTFSAAPGSGVVITADFEFFFPVRFEEDYLPKGLETHGGNTLDTVGVVEERL